MQLFGWPQALCLDAATLRDDALSDDWCMATLHCDRLRVTLHASMLQAAFNPRYAVHGTRGSYVELGLDRQEDALKAGRRPAWPAPADRGIDTGRSTLQVPRGDAISVEAWPLARGCYGDYHAALAGDTRRGSEPGAARAGHGGDVADGADRTGPHQPARASGL